MSEEAEKNFDKEFAKGFDFELEFDEQKLRNFLENWVSSSRQLPKETKILKTNDGRNAVAGELAR